MAIIPRRYKYPRVHRPSYEGKAKGCRTVDFGTWGIQALEGGYIRANQIEAARKAIRGSLNRGGKIWIRIFCHTPFTLKPVGVRMGSGKGSIDHWAAVVKVGTIMFEIEYPDEAMSKRALTLGIQKLPVKCKIVKKNEELPKKVEVPTAVINKGEDNEI